MENKDVKKMLVKDLLKKQKEKEDESIEDLVEMLIDSDISFNVDKEDKQSLTLGERVADKITEVAGSWYFIIGFILFLILWIVVNIVIYNAVDPYPFILLNLLLSCLAALQAPIIMMSQNREAKKDSLRSKNDYQTDLKSEIILEVLHDRIVDISRKQDKILKYIDEKENNKK